MNVPAQPSPLRRYFVFVLRHRYATLGLCLAITLLALWSASRSVIASSIGKLFLDDVPEYASYQARMQRFGNDEVFLVAYEDPAPLSEQSLQALEQVVQRVQQRSEVASVASLLDAVWVGSEEGTLRIEPYVDLARERNPELALALLLEDPLYQGMLVARDGSAAAIMVELSVDPYRAVERGPQLVGEVMDELVAAGFARERLHRTGFPALVAEIMHQSYFNVSRLFPIACLALLAMVLLLFRRLAPAAAALGVGLVSVAWTLGFAAALDREFSIYTALVPAVILTVAFSDIVHLWSAYLLEVRRGLSKRDAILASATDVGHACLLTSATTFTAFVALSLVPTPATRHLGVVLGFGVGMALLLAMTLIPVALSFLAKPVPREKIALGLLDRIVELSSRLSTRRAGWVLAGFALFMVPVGIGLARFEIETDFSKRFAADNSFAQDQRFFERRFSGTHNLEIFLETPEDGGLEDSELFGRIAALHDRLESLPEVDEVLSPVDPVRALHRAIAGEGDLPEAEGAIAQYLLLFEMSGGGAGAGEALENQLDFERRSMRLGLRTQPLGFRDTARLGDRAAGIARELLPEDVEVEASGLVYLLGWYFNHVIDGQKQGLLLSFLVIAVAMIAGLRSLRVGMLSMFPNLLPLFALCAYCSFRWTRVDSDVLFAALMALGIGVDDTIHFLMRYRVEALRAPPGEPRAEALERSFRFAGRAIVMTTAILCAGFLPFAISDYFTIRMLGTLLPGVLVMALLADLLLVPAMAQVGMIRFRPAART